MARRLMVLVVLAAFALPASSFAQGGYTPGAPGIGDPYFPLDGNGGYDVSHYLLDVNYGPPTDVLRGVATISATATQGLSRFNLDLDGLTVRAITVDGQAATWKRNGSELVVTPATVIPSGMPFTTVVRYDGVPKTIGSPELGDVSGFIHTDDGAVVAGQPDVAANWFPVNDHPADKASYLLRLTAPRGTKAIGNGVLVRKTNRNDATTTWVWRASEPMASYLVTATFGQFTVSRPDPDRFSYNAIDPDLFRRAGAHSGSRYAISGVGNSTYARLGRASTIPAGGATMTFWVKRDTETNWDFFAVEAKTSGDDDWTTLPDLNGHTSQSTGRSCPSWLDVHPFLTHYQTPNDAGGCDPTGTTGEWNAATGASNGYEQWKVDLSPWAGKKVRLALAYISDDTVQQRGVFVDDIKVTGATGSTDFESGNGGWEPYPAPADSPGNPNEWTIGGRADEPPTTGDIAQGSLDRQPEIIAFLEDFFGPYPFSASGGIVDDVDDLGFALENQTRPIYSKGFFGDSESGDSVVVHETAHQWTGDDLALERWQDIWLNEGFATYTEWLWAGHEFDLGPDVYFDFYYATIPADDPFWSLTIGDPGPDSLFDDPVYVRGGMTLQALRQTIGDDAFFTLVKQWIAQHRRGNVSTPEFIALAESISGQDLGDFFDAWLYSDTKPDYPGAATDAARVRRPPAVVIAPEKGPGLKK